MLILTRDRVVMVASGDRLEVSDDIKMVVVVVMHYGEGDGQNLFLNLVLDDATVLFGMMDVGDRVQQFLG